MNEKQNPIPETELFLLRKRLLESGAPNLPFSDGDLLSLLRAEKQYAAALDQGICIEDFLEGMLQPNKEAILSDRSARAKLLDAARTYLRDLVSTSREATRVLFSALTQDNTAGFRFGLSDEEVNRITAAVLEADRILAKLPPPPTSVTVALPPLSSAERTAELLNAAAYLIGGSRTDTYRNWREASRNASTDLRILTAELEKHRSVILRLTAEPLPAFRRAILAELSLTDDTPPTLQGRNSRDLLRTAVERLQAQITFLTEPLTLS